MIRLPRLAAMALAAAGLIFSQQTPAPAPPSGAARPGGGNWNASPALRIGVALNLTAAQRAKVESIFENQASQLQPLTPQLQQNREAIQKLAKSDTSGGAFNTQIQALASTQGSLVSKIAVIRATAVSQIWSLLTPEQRAKALQMPTLLNPDTSADERSGERPRLRMRPTRPTRAE